MSTTRRQDKDVDTKHDGGVDDQKGKGSGDQHDKTFEIKTDEVVDGHDNEDQGEYDSVVQKEDDEQPEKRGDVVDDQTNARVVDQKYETGDTDQEDGFKGGVKQLIKTLTSCTTDKMLDEDDAQSKNKRQEATETCQKSINSYPDTQYTPCVQNMPIQDTDDYDFTHQERGYMVLVVNESFYKEAKRFGAEKDRDNMTELASLLQFRLFNDPDHMNLTKQETLTLLKEVQEADHSNFDTFLFVISTHGIEQPNPKANGKLDHALVCADDKLIFTSTILEMFSDKNCPTLKDKPKLFFIQACRGKGLDKGSDVKLVKQTKASINKQPNPLGDKADSISDANNSKTTDSSVRQSVDKPDTHPGSDSWARDKSRGSLPIMQGTHNTPSSASEEYLQQTQRKFTENVSTMESAQSGDELNLQRGEGAIPREAEKVDTPSLKCNKDMLVMFAIPPGMYAWRSTSDGSWMLHFLHEVLTKYIKYDMVQPKNFLHLLTEVSSKMSKRSTSTLPNKTMHEKKAIPVIEHKLTRNVIFK